MAATSYLFRFSGPVQNLADHRDVLSPDLFSHGSRSSSSHSDLLKLPDVWGADLLLVAQGRGAYWRKGAYQEQGAYIGLNRCKCKKERLRRRTLFILQLQPSWSGENSTPIDKNCAKSHKITKRNARSRVTCKG